MARVFLFNGRDMYFGRVENVRNLGFGESIAGRRCLEFSERMEMLRREEKLVLFIYFFFFQGVEFRNKGIRGKLRKLWGLLKFSSQF